MTSDLPFVEDTFIKTLPQLAHEDLIPEVNSLQIGNDGELVVKDRPRRHIVSYDHAGRRITARFEGGHGQPIALEIGCRLNRIPYTVEGLGPRREMLRRVHALQQRAPGRVALTPQQWLYYRDRMTLPPAAMTASWLLTQLTLTTIMLAPVIGPFAALDGTALARPGPMAPPASG